MNTHITLIVLMGMLALVACSPAPEETARNTLPIAPAQEQPIQEQRAQESLRKAPAFEATTITGEIVSLESSLAEGKPLLVYFTASWCPICAKNWPALNEVYPEYADRVTIVSIGIDPTDTAQVMAELADKRGLTYPMVPGTPQIMLDFGVKSQATTVGVDTAGNIVFVKEKQALTADEYRALLDGLLDG